MNSREIKLEVSLNDGVHTFVFGHEKSAFASIETTNGDDDKLQLKTFKRKMCYNFETS